MTTQSISGAIVWPEDFGTGANVSNDAGDYVSAGHLGTLAGGIGTGYAHAGLSLGYNPAGPSVDIGAGVAFVEYTGSSDVQDTSGNYSVSWGHPIAMLVSVPAVSNLSLDAGAVNEVFLAIDPTGENSARYVFGSSVSTPTDPHIKLGEIDTSTDTSTEMSRNPDVSVGALTADSATVSGTLSASSISTTDITGTVVGGDTLTSIVGSNLSIDGDGILNASSDADTLDGVDSTAFAQLAAANAFTAAQTFEQPVDIAEIDGTLTGNAPLTNIAGSNLSIDGSGNLNATDTNTDTDTHTSVSDDGASVVSDTSDINFGSNISVTDDGDGSVTVDSTPGEAVVASGTVTLSSGYALVSTGTTGKMDVYLDPSNGGSNSQNIDVVASITYDSSAGENKIDIAEDTTAVGNPTIAYEVVKW